MKRPTRKRPEFSDLPSEKRQEFAEQVRERIYATITLLAVE